MSGRLARDRPRRDHQPRHSLSSSSSSTRGKNPPSRHLWVGNLPQGKDQATVIDHFSRFGEIDNVAFQQGRSYGFVNYVREEDAVAALKSLQGFSVDGLPLRIEFAKSDKSSAPPRDENYYQPRDELQPPSRRSAFSPRESRMRHPSPDRYLPDSSRTRDDNSTDHPSEILWIGFPTCLKVDETILRRAFSPFGEIDKITVFQGRTYAFVQFRNLESACRAKDTLQGKLFGNPRVHICFARNDSSSSIGSKRGMDQDIPCSPHIKPNGRPGSPDSYPERNFQKTSYDPSMRPPHFPNMEYVDPDITNFSRKKPSWTHGAVEERKFHELGPDVGLPQGLPYCRNPSRDGSAQFHDFSPRDFPKKNPYPEDPWDLPEDAYVYHEAKKLKTGPFPHERELPEYPFHDPEHGKNVFQRRVPDLPLSDETGRTLQYRRLSEFPVNLSLGDTQDNRMQSHDTFHSPPPPFSSNSVEWKRTNSELHQPGLKEEWKWEGTIAKGGTPVCKARCFPVGKVMDILLPEFLDCTARTGLDMLAKHYYQASNSWVVFFVAASDADMTYYNEFMHYLGEKQRAAVAKLDERNTLFLVPPSDFSEHVLKVPGKLSISGVVLSLDPASPSMASLPPENEMMSRDRLYSNVDITLHKSESPYAPFPSSMSYPNVGKLASSLASHSHGNIATSASSSIPANGHGSGSVPDQMGSRHDFQPSNRCAAMGSTWSPHPQETSVPSSRHVTLHALPISEDYQHSVSGRSGLEPNRGNYNSGGTDMSYNGGNNSFLSEHKLSTSMPSLLSGLQPEQQAQLVSSLLGRQRQSLNSTSQSSPEVFRSSGNAGNQPENHSRVPPSYASAHANQLPTGLSTTSFNQLQQPLQAENMQMLPHTTGIGSAQDEGEADPQKRLQATLQLAAALLQQIQQGKGT